MADLVAEVAEQRAIGLVHDGAPLFALGVVGLLERQRDQAVVMPGHHPRPIDMRRTCQKIEHQPFAASLVALIERQLELHQRVEQPMLGDFDLLPSNQIFRDAGVGDGAIMPARSTVSIGRVGRIIQLQTLNLALAQKR